MKKIKIAIKDPSKKEFYIEENAQQGDYFSLDDLRDINFEELEEYVKTNQQEIIQRQIKAEKQNWANEFKSSSEYQSLVETKNKLEQEIVDQKQLFEINLKSQLSEKLNEEIKKIENEKSEELNNLKLENSIIKESNNQLNKNIKEKEQELKEQYRQKEQELKQYFEKEKSNELEIYRLNWEKEKEQELKEQQEKFNNEISIIERKNLNSKLIGENLEQWIKNQYDNTFGTLEDSHLNKTNIAIEGTKPDFIYQLLDIENKNILTSITIEAKSQDPNSTYTKKNSDCYKKLNIDHHKNGTEFSLLVTELEPDNNFAILKVNDYENMYVVRPSFFIAFISLVRTIGIKRKQINKQILILKEKNDIIEEFDKEKTAILDNSIKNINKQLEDIVKKATTIQSSAVSILDSARLITETHLNTVKNKIENLSILKPKNLKKIEEINKEEQNNKILISNKE